MTIQMHIKIIHFCKLLPKNGFDYILAMNLNNNSYKNKALNEKKCIDRKHIKTVFFINYQLYIF